MIGGVAETNNLSGELFRELSEELGVPSSELTMDDDEIPDVIERFSKEENSEIRFVDAETVKGLRFAFGDGIIVRSFFKQVGL